MRAARTLEAGWRQVLRGSVGTGAKEDESSIGRVWAVGFHHVTARSLLVGVLKLKHRLFLSFSNFFFGSWWTADNWISAEWISGYGGTTVFWFKIECQSRIYPHIGYVVWLLKPHQYTAVSSTGMYIDQLPRLQRRCTADLALLCTTNSSGGRQINASTALMRVVCIAHVFPKHASLWTLLRFLALTVWQPGHHTKDSEVMDGLMMET
jgi:hypothetical protein